LVTIIEGYLNTKLKTLDPLKTNHYKNLSYLVNKNQRSYYKCSKVRGLNKFIK